MFIGIYKGCEFERIFNGNPEYDNFCKSSFNGYPEFFACSLEVGIALECINGSVSTFFSQFDLEGCNTF